MSAPSRGDAPDGPAGDAGRGGPDPREGAGPTRGEDDASAAGPGPEPDGPTPSPASGARLPADTDSGRAIALRGQVACLAELNAPNPGNVRPGRDLPGLTAREMMLSAAALGPALASAGRVPVGETILGAVRETRRWVDTNTNLGIVLLFAPVARAAALTGGGADRESAGGAPGGSERGSAPGGRNLAEALEDVLASTTVRDAELAYGAIRTAEPGGLGEADEQDVRGRPTVPLREAMALAADRDAVAAQYATGFRLVRTVGVPAVRAARDEDLGWAEAAQRCFGRLLAERPDSLITRKFGREEAESVRAEASRLLEEGPPGSPGTEARWEDLDRRLRSASPPRNPGTTADLTAAALFLALLDEAGWNYPGNGP